MIRRIMIFLKYLPYNLGKVSMFPIQRLFRKSHYSDMDLWALHIPLARHIRLALEDFYKMPRYSFPTDVEFKPEWDLILRKMINAFRIIENDDVEEQIGKWDEVEEGLKLFSKYFTALWD